MLILVSVLSILVLTLLALWRNYVKRYPLGPPPLPFIGNLHIIDMANIDRQILKWKKTYGPVFTLWMPNPVVIFNDLESIKTHFVKDGESFAGRPTGYLMKVLVGGNYGLILNSNSMYKEQRRFALHSLRDLGFGKATIEKTTVDLAQRMVRKLQKHEGQSISISPFITSAVCNVMNMLVFGVLSDDDEALVWFKTKLDEALASFQTPMMIAIDSIPWLRHVDFTGDYKAMLAANDECLEHIRRQIDQHRQTVNYEDEPRDYVDAFLHEPSKKQFTGDFVPEQLESAVFDLCAAGTGTIISTLRYTFLYLINYPHVQSRIHEEIDTVLGSKEIHLDDTRRLPYLNATLHELQRVANILSLTILHESLDNVVVDGYIVPKGTVVVPQFQSVHLDENEFPRAELFIPERHLNAMGEFVRDDRITPFSVGKRSCLGEALARAQLQIFLATILQTFEVKPEGVIPPKIVSKPVFPRCPVDYKVRLIRRV